MTTVTTLSPADVRNDTLRRAQGHTASLVGSLVLADWYYREHGSLPVTDVPVFNDVDLFVPSQGELFALTQDLLSQGFYMDDRNDRVWYRWRNYGLGKWQTNSIKLFSMENIEYNIVYKLVNGHPLQTPVQVVESFDFGGLAMAWSVQHQSFHDFRPALFPLEPDLNNCPMFDTKRMNWRQGFMSWHEGMNQPHRFVRYFDRKLISLENVRDDLVTGFEASALYHLDKDAEDMQMKGQFYQRMVFLLENRLHDEIRDFYAQNWKSSDPLDQIMEALF
jgi:hypothetical protein